MPVVQTTVKYRFKVCRYVEHLLKAQGVLLVLIHCTYIIYKRKVRELGCQSKEKIHVAVVYFCLSKKSVGKYCHTEGGAWLS